MYDVTSANIAYHLIDVPPIIALGITGGIIGSLYNFLLRKVLRLYNLINEYTLAFYLFSSNFSSKDLRMI